MNLKLFIIIAVQIFSIGANDNHTIFDQKRYFVRPRYYTEVIDKRVEEITSRKWYDVSSRVCCFKGQICTITHTSEITLTVTHTIGFSFSASNILGFFGADVSYAAERSYSVTTSTGYSLQFEGENIGETCKKLIFSPDEIKATGKVRSCKIIFKKECGEYEAFEIYVPRKDENNHAIGKYMLYPPENVDQQRSTKISLKSKANGKYVCADNGGNSPLIANRVVADTWEQFEIYVNSDKTISLKSMANFKFVMASDSGNGPLVARGNVVDTWEKFFIIENPDSTISLKAYINGLFVSFENEGNSPLIANREKLETWEKFIITYY